MKIQYTHKLFHKKYAYKVVLSCQTSGSRWFWPRQDQLAPDFQAVTDWCELHAPNSHKIQRRYQGGSDQHSDWHQNVYLQTDAQKDALVKAQGAAVQEVWQPLNPAHLQTLDVRNIAEVRSQLIYKKYSHVIYFKYDKHHTVYPWLLKLLADSPKSIVKGCIWFPKVYSTDEADVQMIQLSYPEKISHIKHVILLSA